MSRGNDQAYPCVFNSGVVQEGMTIREAFAMAAMQGLVANGQIDDLSEGAISHDARLFADSLLAELEADSANKPD